MYGTGLKKKDRCECGKVCFNKREAQEKKNFLHKLGRAKFLRVYQCDLCDFFHLTKQRKHNEE